MQFLNYQKLCRSVGTAADKDVLRISNFFTNIIHNITTNYVTLILYTGTWSVPPHSFCLHLTYMRIFMRRTDWWTFSTSTSWQLQVFKPSTTSCELRNMNTKTSPQKPMMKLDLLILLLEHCWDYPLISVWEEEVLLLLLLLHIKHSTR